MNTNDRTTTTTKHMRKQLVIDLGPTLATIDAEPGGSKDTTFFTTYVNGISLRSHNLHLPAVKDRFVRAIWLMAGGEGGFILTADGVIRTWIDEQVTGG